MMLVRNYTEILFTLIKKDEYDESIKKNVEEVESPFRILLSITIPFLVAGFGMVGAGILLDIVNNWPLYRNISEIIVLVPPLLGLKGNLEMTLAARLSTQVNIGKIHDKKTTLSAIFGNSIIIQLQSIIVGFLASLIAILMTFIKNGEFHPKDILIIMCSSVTTASLASLLLATLVMVIIIISHKFNVNPDNIATPIASSLGDIVTLAILSGFGSFIYEFKESIALPITIIVAYIILIPVFIYLCYKNEFVKETLYQGWVPVIMAMLISTGSGLVLDESSQRYSCVTIFQPVVNGIGGNLVAIMASRLSTAIHRTTIKGEYPSWAPQKWIKYPYETFFGDQNPESKTIQLLVALIIPGHLIFFFTLFFITQNESNLELSVWLVVFYIAVTFIQVIILFLICYWLVLLAWKLKKDPDNVCIPYLTSSGDLIGTVFLLFAMHMTYLAGNQSVLTHEILAINNTTLFNNENITTIIEGASGLY